MAVNYEDERLQAVETEKQEKLNEVEETYGDMIDGVDEKYQGLIDASEEWKNTQSQIQQEQTDFTIEQIGQQREQAQKEYTKEQSGAYTDWQKQSAQHGVNAEQMASMGMTGTGYSESSQVSMYNTYQNRIAAARETYNQAVQNYDNAIKEARLQNNSALAQIAYNALQQQLELSLEGFQYKNSLVLERANKKAEVESIYDGLYLDVLNQLATIDDSTGSAGSVISDDPVGVVTGNGSGTAGPNWQKYEIPTVIQPIYVQDSKTGTGGNTNYSRFAGKSSQFNEDGTFTVGSERLTAEQLYAAIESGKVRPIVNADETYTFMLINPIKETSYAKFYNNAMQ